MKVLMIIPAYNEAMNLENVVEDINSNFKEADILFVNDCSKDNTLEVIKKIENVEYVDLPINLGYSYAVQTGLKYAVEYGYDYLIQFDGDGQHLASEAKKMYKYALEKNIGVVIGSRFLKETSYSHSFFRKVGTGLFQKIIKMLTGKKISDPTSGLQVIKRDVFLPLSKMYGYPEFPDANLLIQLIYQGVTIGEIPVEMKNREFGESMHGGIIKPIKYMIKMFYYIIIVFATNLYGKANKK
ncbi:glycosyltransferase family 2 protein [Acetobacterium tundrae]|uniref:Glycosyltransferase n=1 Tax=Acetobacterium tundrae TaxID=132932 RepID=A0ABR6WJY9_9FIRM|nr:glycosyltransferase family 2 protein [Acetobacterium tundrae]MBC3796741.1 glycosyltransferase [Acetobacterium tundrae]